MGKWVFQHGPGMGKKSVQKARELAASPWAPAAAMLLGLGMALTVLLANREAVGAWLENHSAASLSETASAAANATRAPAI
jgi:hypothetical protein